MNGVAGTDGSRGTSRARDEAKRWVIKAAVASATVGAVFGLLHLLDVNNVYHFSTPLPIALQGVMVGLTYGLLAAGIVLIYRANRIVNFAHGQIGVLGAALLGLAVVRWHVPYWVGFPFAIGVSCLVGATIEVAVVRRLRHAPRLMTLVATLGAGSFLAALAATIGTNANAFFSTYPQPPGLPEFNVGALRFTQAYTGMLILSPLAVVGLAAFLRYSRFGIALRSAAANPEAARLSGIFAGRMSSLTWMIAGALSGFAAILTQPTQGLNFDPASFGPGLLLRGLTAAVVARMSSLPAALSAGIGLGVVEQLMLWNYPHSGLVEAALFVVTLLVLAMQSRRGGRDEEKGSWAAVEALRPLPASLRRLWPVRNLGLISGVVLLCLAAALPLLITHSDAVTLTSIMAFSIVGLAIGLLTGLGGQLSLGQFGIAAIGAVISLTVAQHTGNYLLAFLCAGLVAGIASVIIGLPALRVRGQLLAVTSLAFALVAPAWLLEQPWMLGEGKTPGRPVIFQHSLTTGKSYYYFGLAIFGLCLLLTRNVRRSGVGRRFVAIRDNEDNARAFTIKPWAVKLQGYLAAGFIAGVGGALYGHLLSNISAASFPPTASIQVVVMTVVGGISVLAGPLLGALYVLGIPSFVHLDAATTAATQFGLLILILYLPAGLAQVVAPIRDRLAAWIGRLYGVPVAETDVGAVRAGDALARGMTAVRERSRPEQDRSEPGRWPASTPGATLLRVNGLSKRFGGLTAVDDVSFTVWAGETVGLIGPNGAGKTTTFELIGGFVREDEGQVIFDQRDVTLLSAEERGRLGLIRSFQDAALFPTMTVIDTVKLALERVAPSHLAAAIVGSRSAERASERRAEELLAFMGLSASRDKRIRELSTGMRRITEIACLVALEPTLLMLDEPSSGIAQRETEALGELLDELKKELRLTLLVIEHDIPLIMALSDGIIAMAEGRIIAAGSPEEVRADPLVVDAYLGRTSAAIERTDFASEKVSQQ